MKVEAWYVHFFRPRHNVQAVKATQDAWMHLHVDPLGSTTFPKLGEPLIFEALDHQYFCKQIADKVNLERPRSLADSTGSSALTV